MNNRFAEKVYRNIKWSQRRGESAKCDTASCIYAEQWPTLFQKNHLLRLRG